MDYKKYFDESVDYLTYQNEFITKSNNPSAYNFGEYIPMNQHRSARIDRTFELSEEQKHIAKETTKRTWLVIIEHWCGDASQIIPLMNTNRIGNRRSCSSCFINFFKTDVVTLAWVTLGVFIRTI
jgi:hypothetical protein